MRAEAQTRAPAVLHRLTQILCHLRNYTEPVFQVLHRRLKLLACMHDSCKCAQLGTLCCHLDRWLMHHTFGRVNHRSDTSFESSSWFHSMP